MARQQTASFSDQSLPISSAAPGKPDRRAFLWEAGVIGVVLGLSLLLRLWHLSSVTDNYDEGVYWSSLRAMSEGKGLFSPIFSSQPPFFLLSLYPLVALFGPTLLAARLGVVLLSLIGILALYVLARRLGGPWAGVGAALLLGTDYLFLIQSQSVQAEVPSVALMLVALAAAAYVRRYPWQAALLSGAATALAILEKLFAVAVLAPVLVLFLGDLIAFERALPFLKPAEQKAGALARLRLPQRQTIRRAAVLTGAYLAGLALAGLLVFLPYFNQLQAISQQMIGFHVAADQHYASTLSQNPGTLLGITTEYPLEALGLLGVIIGLMRRRWSILVAAAWILAALVLLLRQAPLFPHHVPLLIPGLALSAAIGLAPAPETLATEAAALRAYLQRIRPGLKSGASKALLLGFPALLLTGIFLFSLREAVRHPLGPVGNAAQLAQIASDVQRLTTPQQQVLADDQYIADLADRDVPPELVDTSIVRIRTGYLTTEQVIAIAERPQVAAILFYTGRFDDLPGFRAWVAQHFHLARSYGTGQDLYLRAAPSS